jgi:HPt (histidine-containing phosphotransfer) domain-containing protein
MSVLDPAPTVFDCGAVRSLTGHSGDREFARVFVSRYRQLLPLRVRRIIGAVRDGDLDEAMDAVLSLKTASSTAGTGELFELGARIEGHLRQLDLPSAALLSDELHAAAQRAHRALTAFLGG